MTEVVVEVGGDSPAQETIWLVETSGRTHLLPLELCSLESAARHHPNTSVTFLLVSPHLETEVRLARLSSALSNIKVRHLSLDNIFAPPSPLAPLWRSGAVSASKWPVRSVRPLELKMLTISLSHTEMVFSHSDRFTVVSYVIFSHNAMLDPTVGQGWCLVFTSVVQPPERPGEIQSALPVRWDLPGH